MIYSLAPFSLLKAARFPELKSLDDFNFAFNTSINKKQIRELASCRFVHQAESVLDEFGMRNLPATTAEDLLEIFHRRYHRSATIIATNRPLEDWGKILGDNAAFRRRDP